MTNENQNNDINLRQRVLELYFPEKLAATNTSKYTSLQIPNTSSQVAHSSLVQGVNGVEDLIEAGFFCKKGDFYSEITNWVKTAEDPLSSVRIKHGIDYMLTSDNGVEFFKNVSGVMDRNLQWVFFFLKNRSWDEDIESFNKITTSFKDTKIYDVCRQYQNLNGGDELVYFIFKNTFLTNCVIDDLFAHRSNKEKVFSHIEPNTKNLNDYANLLLSDEVTLAASLLQKYSNRVMDGISAQTFLEILGHNNISRKDPANLFGKVIGYKSKPWEGHEKYRMEIIAENDSYNPLILDDFIDNILWLGVDYVQEKNPNKKEKIKSMTWDYCKNMQKYTLENNKKELTNLNLTTCWVRHNIEEPISLVDKEGNRAPLITYSDGNKVYITGVGSNYITVNPSKLIKMTSSSP